MRIGNQELWLFCDVRVGLYVRARRFDVAVVSYETDRRRSVIERSMHTTLLI